MKKLFIALSIVLLMATGCTITLPPISVTSTPEVTTVATEAPTEIMALTDTPVVVDTEVPVDTPTETETPEDTPTEIVAITDVPTEVPTVTPTDTETPMPTVTPTELPIILCLIKGNVSSSGEKIYHVPGQPTYDETQIDVSKGDKLFCTEEDARADGFRRAER